MKQLHNEGADVLKSEQPSHTPGPWKHSKASVYIEREFDNDLWVAECRTYEDAQFISSAPELHKENVDLKAHIEKLKAVIKNLNTTISYAENIIWTARDGRDFKDNLNDYIEKYHQ